MPLSLPERLSHDIGMISQLFGSGIDTLFCIRVYIRGVVQCTGDSAYINTGKFCYIFQCGHISLLMRTILIKNTENVNKRLYSLL